MRAATSADHLGLERMLALEWRTSELERYRDLLAAFLAFYEPLETALGRLKWNGSGVDFENRRKAGWLRADLAQCGHAAGAVGPRAEVPPVPDLPAAFGALYVTEGATLAQHGSIFATSDGPGLGTTIHITLPTISGAPKLQETTVPPGGAVESRAYHLLVVEDDRDTAEFMTLVLEKRGYRVTMAHSRAEALAAIGAHEFDAVLSDIGLPDGSGQDLIRELRARRQIPAIALSGYGMEQDVAASRAAGFDEHVTKPATITALDAALGRLLGVKSE